MIKWEAQLLSKTYYLNDTHLHNFLKSIVDVFKYDDIVDNCSIQVKFFQTLITYKTHFSIFMKHFHYFSISEYELTFNQMNEKCSKRESNLGLLSYTANALPIEIPGLTIGRCSSLRQFLGNYILSVIRKSSTVCITGN